jgi:acetyl-CoA acyltransferase
VIFESDENVAIAYGMGLTAEKVVQQWKVSPARTRTQFALESHHKALAAIAAGRFRDEVLPYACASHLPDLATGTVRMTERLFDTDEGPRADSTARSGQAAPGVPRAVRSPPATARRCRTARPPCC